MLIGKTIALQPLPKLGLMLAPFFTVGFVFDRSKEWHEIYLGARGKTSHKYVV